MFKADVWVTLKKSILDPQGQAIKDALHALNYQEVRDARLGKLVQVELEASSKEEAHHKISEMCEKLLANTVIEDYQIHITEVQ
ncbi:MAG: phosphoribosylformylglycinamidine synthase subunit PurS [Bacillota bacterium]|nr:phosphoribosylformylglycinamidine synthase subunit PurS [Bacillota bacterium]